LDFADWIKKQRQNYPFGSLINKVYIALFFLSSMKNIIVYRDLVNDALKEFFASKIARFSSGIEKDAFEQLVDFTMRGGKRLRPILGLHMFYCFEGKEQDEQEIVKALLPFELIQSYLLIHDDVMDRDITRRGKPTVHSYYAIVLDDEHRGYAMAINVGDLAESLAREPLHTANIPDYKKLFGLKMLDEMLQKEVSGQLRDIHYETVIPSAKEVLDMYMLKTVPYTTQYPMIVGAHLGNAPAEALEAIDKASKPLGIAFQITDDLLGLYSTQAKTGKPVGSDIRSGKNTYIIAKAREELGEEFMQMYHQVFGNSQATTEEVQAFSDALVASGLISAIEHDNDLRVEEAIDLIRPYAKDSGAFKAFEGLASYLSKRDF
jgi:geranylgeranyl diphosphate synthase, type I